jgi:hypothetical protein
MKVALPVREECFDTTSHSPNGGSIPPLTFDDGANDASTSPKKKNTEKKKISSKKTSTQALSPKTWSMHENFYSNT